MARAPEQVFDFFADMSLMAEWAKEDFVAVQREGDGPIGKGTRFTYETNGANAKSVFAWDTFDKPRALTFSGPRVDVGPGWVEGLGGYLLAAKDGGTLVRAWYEPKLGGLLALMSPFARMRNIRMLGKQLAKAKAMIEAEPA
jgi:hypothetical protein